MISKIPSIFLLFVSMSLISSAYTLNVPTNFTWPQNTTKLCFAARFDLALNVDYISKNGTKASVKIPLNNDTYESYSVSCSPPADIHELTISMFNGFTNILFQFFVNDKNSTSLKKVYGFITVNDQQKYIINYSDETEGVHNFTAEESLFVANRGNSYRCNTKTMITGFSTNGSLTVTSIDLENLRLQPFIDDSKEFNDFGVEQVCSADIEKNSNLIPIIVGASLAVLVVIVLVAYIIGRRRSRNGYQSV